jgi:hypothetical protein
MGKNTRNRTGNPGCRATATEPNAGSNREGRELETQQQTARTWHRIGAREAASAAKVAASELAGGGDLEAVARRVRIRRRRRGAVADETTGEEEMEAVV